MASELQTDLSRRLVTHGERRLSDTECLALLLAADRSGAIPLLRATRLLARVGGLGALRQRLRGGIAEDLQGRMWTATQGGVGWVDSETMVVGDIVPLPGNYLYRGIGVDVDGYIWAVQLGGTQAYKIDPDTYETWFVDGLNGPYTYSDMTGGQIAKVLCPQ